jgi:probable HAF family extracellular repeat protein
MKRLSRCFLGLLVIFLATGASVAHSSNYGLFIGLQTPAASTLKGDADATLMYSKFKKSSNYGYAVLLTGDTVANGVKRQDIQNDIAAMGGLMASGDTFFLYISSHGADDNYYYNIQLDVGYDAYGINNGGKIVVESGGGDNFVYYGGNYMVLPSLPGAGIYANAINDAGLIVGVCEDSTGEHGFLYGSGGNYTLLNAPGAFSTYAFGMNNVGAGQIVGGYQDNTGEHGFMYSGGNYTTLPSPPGAPAGAPLWANGINDAGDIVGVYNRVHGFLYSGGTYTFLDVPGASATIPCAINNFGQVVGTYRNATGLRGFLYSAGTGDYTILPTPKGASDLTVYGINDAGQIVGYYTRSDGAHGFLATPGEYVTIGPPDWVLTDTQLTLMLKSLPDAVRKVVLIDACYCGGFWGTADPDNRDLQSIKNLAFFAASTDDKKAYYNENGLSLFTQAFLNAFSSNRHGSTKADANNDGSVTQAELLSYVQNWGGLTPYYNATVAEKDLGDPVLFTPSLWTPVGFTTDDFVDGLQLGHIRGSDISAILLLLLD